MSNKMNKKSFNSIEVKFKKLHQEAQLPIYATEEAAGMDVRSVADMAIGKGQYAMIPTGLSVEIPKGWELQVRPRSGLAAKNGVTVLNSPGTVDSDYRGEIKVLLINHGEYTFSVKSGDRIAQLVLAKAPQASIVEVKEIAVTERNSGGFGSTGID